MIKGIPPLTTSDDATVADAVTSDSSQNLNDDQQLSITPVPQGEVVSSNVVQEDNAAVVPPVSPMVSTPQASLPAQLSAQPQPQLQPAKPLAPSLSGGFDDPLGGDFGGDDFFGDGGFGGGFGGGGATGGGFGRNNSFGGGSAFGGGGGSGTSMSREDRTKMIKRLYKDVLGREAQTRDINYYKYGTQNEDQIRSQLLKSDEHKEVIKKGRKFDAQTKELEETKTKLQASDSKVLDAHKENETLKIILDQKNAEITRLRASNSSLTSVMVNPQPYAEPAPVTQPVQQPPVQQPVYQPQPQIQPVIQPTIQPVETAQPYSPVPVEAASDPTDYNYTPPQNTDLPASTTNQGTSEQKKDLIDRITSLFF